MTGHKAIKQTGPTLIKTSQQQSKNTLKELCKKTRQRHEGNTQDNKPTEWKISKQELE